MYITGGISLCYPVIVEYSFGSFFFLENSDMLVRVVHSRCWCADEKRNI